MKVVGGIFLPASARVCGERWSDPGPPPVIPPPAPGLARVASDHPGSVACSGFRAGGHLTSPALTSLMTSWAPFPGGERGSGPVMRTDLWLRPPAGRY